IRDRTVTGVQTCALPIFGDGGLQLLLNEAEKELQTAITNEGDSANIEAELGRIAYARSDIEQAFAHYTKAYSFNSGNVDAQLGLARVLAAQEKPQEAVKYLREAIVADP